MHRDRRTGRERDGGEDKGNGPLTVTETHGQDQALAPAQPQPSPEQELQQYTRISVSGNSCFEEIESEGE